MYFSLFFDPGFNHELSAVTVSSIPAECKREIAYSYYGGSACTSTVNWEQQEVPFIELWLSLRRPFVGAIDQCTLQSRRDETKVCRIRVPWYSPSSQTPSPSAGKHYFHHQVAAFWKPLHRWEPRDQNQSVNVSSNQNNELKETKMLCIMLHNRVWILCVSHL